MATATHKPAVVEVVETVVEEEVFVLELTLAEARAVSARMTDIASSDSAPEFTNIYHALRSQGIVGFGYFDTKKSNNYADIVTWRDTPFVRDTHDPKHWSK